MAKIYISYSNADKGIASRISKNLADLGHEILIDSQELIPGIDWRARLSEALNSADGVITLISENSSKSQFVMSEIGAARTYLEADKSKFLIPVIIGDIEIPPIIQDLQCLFTEDSTLEEVASQINQAMLTLSMRKRAELDKQAKHIEKIESNLSKYVDGAMAELKIRENRNKVIGNIWYALGFVCLLIGVVFGINGIGEFLHIKFVDEFKWNIVCILIIKTIVIIGLLIACSKYSFTLGKAYVNEGLKNADRLHAISFGKFYLDVYGSNAKWEDLKEAFQYWNINNESSFSKHDTGQYDPRIVETAIEISKLISRNEKK
jgi:hypothetical protein